MQLAPQRGIPAKQPLSNNGANIGREDDPLSKPLGRRSTAGDDNQDESLPTPLRRRPRADSPAACERSAQRTSPGKTARSVERDTLGNIDKAKSSHEARAPHKRLITPTLVGLVLIVLGILMQIYEPMAYFSSEPLNVSMVLQPGHEGTNIVQNDNETQEIWVPSRRKQLIDKALACKGLRQDIIDVIAGIPFEFGGDVNLHLLRLARAAAVDTPDSSSQVEKQLHETLLQLSVTAGGWSTVLHERLNSFLRKVSNGATCSPNCILSPSVHLEIDEAATSQGAGQGGRLQQLHRLFLEAGAATGLPTLSERAERFRVRPPSVTVADSSAKTGDCFAFRGNASVAFHVLGSARPARIQHIVIEHLPSWATLNPQSAPRHFSVYGKPVGNEQGSQSYSVHLGSFEYVIAAPTVQAFELSTVMELRGLLLVFEGPGWGSNYACLYRVRAFEKQVYPLCSGSRLAYIEQ